MAPTQRQRSNPQIKKDLKRNNEKKQTKTDYGSDIKLVYPSGDTALKYLLLVRFCSALWSHITDCDETYNYWEPSHFLLYKTGHQTWEYSPEYALRSYTYLLMHMVPAKIYSYLFEPNPIHVFYFTRCLLSVCSALSEVYFYKNVCREFGVHIGRLTLAFLLVSTGMFISSAAFLPSSFSMYLSTVALSAWYGRKYELAIFTTAVSALLGWPFVSLVSLPIALELLLRRKQWFLFIKWVLISAIVVLIPMILIDSIYFGKLVIAPLNIFLYNVFTHGPDIYGTEPFSFYFINGFLNFNFIFIAALVTPLALIINWSIVPANSRHPLCLPYIYSLSPFYLWILLFSLLPHKEERFLFPVYPLICLNGAVTVDILQKIYFFIRNKIVSNPEVSHYLQCTTHIMVSAIFICGFFGFSRTYTLYKGYYAPMEVMTEANKLGLSIPKDVTINFCIGKEWHRFPSSFFFPTNNWKLQFLKSEFKGQLPQPFLDQDNATSIIQPNFNNLNKEEVSRYFDVEKCHFLLDLDYGKETELEPNYSRQSDKFNVIKSAKFLNAKESHPLLRAFYFPFTSPKFYSYGSYNLLQSTKFKSMISAKRKST